MSLPDVDKELVYNFSLSLFAGIIASLLVTSYYNAEYSPATSPDLELRKPVITGNAVKVTVENNGKQSAKNKGIAITSKETDYVKTKYLDINSRSSKSRYFYNLPKGKLQMTLSPEHIKIHVKNKSLADSICQETTNSSNLSSSIVAANIKYKIVWKKKPAKYTVAFGNNETKEITQDKDLIYPLESTIVNTSINQMKEEVMLEKNNGKCYLRTNSDDMELPMFEFHHTIDNYLKNFN